MKYVYLLTTGDGDDGNEWSVQAIYATREAADRAKVDFDTEKHYRPDGTFYNRTSNEVEEWELQ